MSRRSEPRILAARLADAARRIATVHGDVRAQTVAYALLLRRLDPYLDVSSLLDGFDDPAAIAHAQEVLDAADIESVCALYASDDKDPAVYFYEQFARFYDPASARGRGTLYTPPQLVSCIVRGVDWLLRERIGVTLDDALVVDPCCGVGTFLRHIELQTEHRPKMIGVELMPAACRIARCLLREAEVLEANWLSDVPIDAGGRVVAIVGNPPYSGRSANPCFDKLSMLGALMGEYRDGLRERNPKWLQDDYVKFIRMAQHQIERAGRGVVAFVTNHSYLFNPTFRAMRRSLARAFDAIYVLDLGGNVKRLDKLDENVFPIQMGVAISFFVRIAGSADSEVRYASIRGTRREKLSKLASLEPRSVTWTDAAPAEPFHIFVPQDSGLREEFYGFASLFEIFGEHTMGFVTSQDSFAIAFTKQEVLSRMGVLRFGQCAGSSSPLRMEADATRKRTEPRTPETACLPDLEDCHVEDEIIEVLYRPFDRRWAWYSRQSMERPRLPFMRNLMRQNLALAIGRAGQVTGSDEWDVVFVTDRPADLNLFRRGGAKLFPRYVYKGDQRISNMRVGGDHDELFAYIYALLHSRAYRERYAELLAADYPRIPMPQDERVIPKLAELGRRLMDVHLMRGFRPHPYPPRSGEGECSITIGGYREPEKCLNDRSGVDTQETAEAVRAAVARTLETRAEIDEMVTQNPPWRRA